MPNYVPFTIPEEPLEAQGPLSGLRRSRAEEMLRQAEAQGIQGMQLGNENQQLQNERYRQLTGPEVAIKGYEGATATARNTPGYIESLLNAERGDHGVRQAQGSSALATHESASRLQNSANDLATFRNYVMAARARGAANPLEGQAIYQEGMSKVQDPRFKSLLPKAFTVENMDAILNVLADTPEHRQQQGLHRMDNVSRETIAKGNNLTARDISAADNASRERQAQIKLNPKLKESLENILASMTRKLQSGQPLTEHDKAAASWAQQMLNNTRQQGMDPVAMQLMLMQALGLMPQGGQPPVRQPPAPVAPPTPGSAANTAPLGTPSNPIVLK